MTTHSQPKGRFTRKALATTSVLSILASMSFASAAQAQIVITDGQTTPVFDPNGATVDAAAGVTQTIADTSSDDDPDNGNIVLDGSSNDGTVITNSGTLINLDVQDENTVIFIDNGEDDVVVTNTATGTLQGINGVIFAEGDGASITNAGVIEGTGVATEGVVYFDRDADGNTNTLDNSGTISSVGGGTIVVDTLLGSVGGEDPQDADAAGAPVTFSGTADLSLTNSGTITNTATMGETEAILFDGAPGNTSEGSLEIDRPEEFAIVSAAFPAGSDGIDPSNGDLNSDSEINPRTCVENVVGQATQQINCIVNLDITNTGTINSDSGAAIANRDDAVLTGSIANAAGGTISGGTAGLQVVGAQGAHDLTIDNSGAIEASDGAGVQITGDGVTLVNTATGTIEGATTGLLVEASTVDTDTVTRSALNNFNIFEALPADGSGNVFVEPLVETTTREVTAGANTFTNAGTITGATSAVDLTDAGAAITFNQLGGGALTGDFLGTTGFDDTLNISGGAFTLTDDVLQTVDVNVASDADVTFTGGNTIDGDLVSDGNLIFDINNDAIVVNGDTTLNAGSTVTIEDATGVAAINEAFTLIDVGGTLTNNAALDATAITDNSLFLDFQPVADSNGDLAVIATAAMVEPEPEPPVVEPEPPVVEPEPPVVEPDPAPVIVANLGEDNLNAFAASVENSFAAGGLDGTSTFTALAGLEADGQIEGAALIAALAPDLSNAVGTETLRVIEDAGAIIHSRLSNFRWNPNSVTAQQGGNVSNVRAEDRYATADTGAWVQGGIRFGTQDNRASSTTSFANNNYTTTSTTVAIGYDHALDDTTIVGLAGSFSSVSIEDNGDAVNNDRDLDVFQVGVYGGKQYGQFHFNGQASYIFGDVEASRQAFEAISSETDLDGFNVEASAVYDYAFAGNYYVAPLVSVRYSTVGTDAFTEAGGLGLNVESADVDELALRGGLTLGLRQDHGGDSISDFFISGSVVTDLEGDSDNLEFAFADQVVSVETLDLDDPRAEVKVGVKWFTLQGWTVNASAKTDFADDYFGVGGNLRLKYNF